MSGGPIPVRYAQALLEIAVEANNVASIRRELDLFAEAYRQSQDLRTVLHNPSILADDRRALVRALGKKLGLSTLITNFLLLLVDKDRMKFIVEISQHLGKLADDAQGLVRAHVTSAFELPAPQQARMKDLLAKLTGRSVILETAVDPNLLGGVVTRVDGKVYDGSLRTQLAQLRQAAARQL